MKNAAVCVFVVLAIASCRPETPTLPFEDEELISILIDLHLAEGAMQRVPGVWKDSIGTELRSRVALAHDLTPDDLEAIVGQLQLMPDKSVELYDSVITRLERQQEQYIEQ